MEDGVEPGADGGVDDFAVDTVNLEVVHTRGGVKGAGPDVFEGAFEGDGLGVFVALARLGGGANGAEGLVALNEPMGQAFVVDDHVGGAVAEGGVDAGGPEVGWFDYVGVGGYYFQVRHGFHPLCNEISKGHVK